MKRLPPSDSEDANNYDNSGTTPSSPVVYDLCDSEEAEEEELAEVLSDADTLGVGLAPLLAQAEAGTTDDGGTWRRMCARRTRACAGMHSAYRLLECLCLVAQLDRTILQHLNVLVV